MAAKALEQSDLRKKGYKWRDVQQHKEVTNGIKFEHVEDIEFVEADFDDPIEHDAFYKVVVVRKKLAYISLDLIIFKDHCECGYC